MDEILKYVETHWARPKPSLAADLRMSHNTNWCEFKKVGRGNVYRYIEGVKKMDEKKIEQLNLLPFQKKSIQSLIQKRNHMSYLASLTKHSKKKKRHLDGVQFYQEVIEDAYQEYVEMNAVREREEKC